MTIKWVKVGSARHERRAVLLRLAPDRAPAAGAALQRLRLTELLKDHPELRVVGIAAAYTFAADHRERYAEFFEADGSLAGPGYTEDEAARLPEQYRLPGIVVKPSRRGRDLTGIRESGASGIRPIR